MGQILLKVGKGQTELRCNDMTCGELFHAIDAIVKLISDKTEISEQSVIDIWITRSIIVDKIAKNAKSD